MSSTLANQRPRLRKLAWVLGGACAFLLLATIVLRVFFHGERLGAVVEDALNDRIRGSVSIGSIDWDMSDLPSLLSGDWLRVDMHDVVVKDEHGRKVLTAPRVTAKLAPHAAAFGRSDLIIKDLVLHEGAFIRLRQIPEPIPLHEYDLTVVSLMSAFYGKVGARSFYAGIYTRPTMIADIKNFEVRDATVRYEFPEFTAETHGVNGKGSMYFNGTDPLSKKMYFSLTPTAERGWLDIAGTRTNLRDIKVSRLAQLPNSWPLEPVAHDVQFAASAMTEDGAQLAVRGGLKDYWTSYWGGEYDIQVDVTDAGQTARRLSQGAVGGDDLRVSLHVSGPKLGPRVESKVAGLEYKQEFGDGAPPIELILDDFRVKFDFATSAGTIEKVVASRKNGKGKVTVAGEFQFTERRVPTAPATADRPAKYLRGGCRNLPGKTPTITSAEQPSSSGGESVEFEVGTRVHISVDEAIDIGPYLPPSVRKIVGVPRLEGSFTIESRPDSQRIDNINVRLGAARIRGGVFRQHRLFERGTTLSKELELHTQNLRVEVGGHTSIVARDGVVNLTERALALSLAYRSDDVAKLAKLAAAPNVAERLRGSACIRGPIDDIVATTSGVAEGVPFMGNVAANIHYRDKTKTLELRKARSTNVDGSFEASGVIRLGAFPRIVRFDTEAIDINLAKIPIIGGFITGRSSGKVHIAGPMSKLRGHGKVTATPLSIAEEPYKRFEIRAYRKDDGTQVVHLNIERTRGGIVDAKIELGKANQLGGKIAIKKLALESLPFLQKDGHAPVGGIADIDLALSGSLNKPTATGTIAFVQTWYGAAFLGPAKLYVKTTGPGQLALTGHMFQGRVGITGAVATTAPYDTRFRLDMHRVELDQFLPEIAEDYSLRGWISGGYAVQTRLSGSRAIRSNLELREAVLIKENEDRQGRPAPVVLRNRGPIKASFDGETVALLEPAIFGRNKDDYISLRGQGSRDKLDFQFSGTVGMALLKPYLRDYFDEVSGNLEIVESTIRGSEKQPKIDMRVKLKNVRMRPSGQDEELIADAGVITLSNQQLVFDGPREGESFGIALRDSETGKLSTLTIRGGIMLDDFIPTDWMMTLQGQLAGKLLPVLVPNYVSTASGVATIEDELALYGSSQSPKVSGALLFAQKNPLTIRPRGAGFELRLTSGEARLDEFQCDGGQDDSDFDYATEDDEMKVCFNNVSGWLDDEGHIESLDALIELSDWNATGLEVTVNADNIPLPLSNDLDVTANLDNLRIHGSLAEEEIDIDGDIVINGRYTRNFNFIKQVLEPAKSTSSGPSIYKTNPLLANARLNNVTIRIPSFRVKNNIANLEFTGTLYPSKTLADPRIRGTIRVQDGTLQAYRLSFADTSGDITFQETRVLGDNTPTINISSEAQYQDISGQQHLINLQITGSWPSVGWNATSDTGLDRRQVLALVSSGQTTEDFKRTLGDEPLGDTTLAGRNPNAGEDPYEVLVKGVAGDFLDYFIGPDLKRLTGLDIVRLEVGTSSLRIHGEKLFKTARAVADFEKNLRGLEIDGRLELRLNQNLSAEGDIFRTDFQDDAEQDVTDARLRLVWRRTFQ